MWASVLSAFTLALLAMAHGAPNLIFMITDDQDSVFDSVNVMPNYLQRMRDEGMKMSNAFVASPKCCPSRTALLSGRFPHSLDDQDLGWCGNFLTEHMNKTFITQLKRHGYRTGFFGKMINLMGQMCAQHNPVIPAGFNIGEGDAFVAMCNEVIYYKNTFNVNGQFYTTGTSPSDYLTAFIGNKTIPWLRAAAEANANGGAPFFAYVAPHAPHLPAQPAPWYADHPLPSQIAPRVPSYNAYAAGKNWAIQENPPFDSFTADGIDQLYRDRLRTLISVDDLVRDMFDALEQAGVLNNTYVITTSDHGYHLGQFHVPFEKNLPYETDVRVPFYVRGPGIQGGTVNPHLVSLMDVGATFLELAGVTSPGQRTTDGRSLVPLFSGKQVPWRDRVLIEYFGWPTQWMTVCEYVFNASGCPSPRDVPYLIDGPQNTYEMLRIINGTMDLTYAEFRPQAKLPLPHSTNWTEAYNNAADPWQQTNVALSGGLPPATMQALSAELWAVAACATEECP